jgi:hypothetical protein
MHDTRDPKARYNRAGANILAAWTDKAGPTDLAAEEKKFRRDGPYQNMVQICS